MDSSSEREKESMTSVVSLVVADFLRPLEDPSRVNQINVDTIKASAKILHKIIRNALREDIAATTANSDAYRKIRLSNPTIQKKIVQVPGAVDVLTVVGFAYCELDDDGKSEKYLVFVPDGDNLGLGNLASIVIQEELEKYQTREDVRNAATASTVTVAAVSKPDDGDKFLSEKERKERNIKSKKARKVKLAQKEIAMRRWEEDKEARMEIKKRKLVVKQKDRKGIFGDHGDGDQEISEHNSSVGGYSTNDTIQKLTHTDDNESLQSVRSKIAQAWRVKQQHQRQTGGGGHDVISKGKTIEIIESEPLEDMDATIEDTHKDDNKEPSLSLPPPNNDDKGNDDDMKPAAKTSITKDEATIITTPNTAEEMLEASLSWENCLKCVPRCGPANGIRDSSTFYKKGKNIYTASSISPTCFRRLFTEFDDLKSSLPSDKRCSAWLRFDEETPQYIRALLTAPLPGPSPYSGGLFTFDIYIPDTYPLVPPKVQIINTGGGTVRFGPNLYADGKVCLSLLGTWPGPKWNSKQSSLLQVLVSIQSLMLGVEHPYFLEPGYGGWEAQVKEGDFASVGKTLAGEEVTEDLTLPSRAWLYEDKIRLGSIRYGMLEPLGIASRKSEGDDVDSNNDTGVNVKPALKYLLPFEDVIKAHFYHNGEETLLAVTAWLNANRPTNLNTSHRGPPNSTTPPLTTLQMASQGSMEYPTHVLDSLQKLFTSLQLRIEEAYPPTLCTSNKSSLIPIPAAAAANNSPSLSIDPASTADGVATLVNDKPERAQDEEDSKNSDLGRLRRQMQEAAQNTNFILAGQLQKEIKEIEEYDNKVAELKEKMESAALEGDFILAGEYQAELKSVGQDQGKHDKRIHPQLPDQNMIDSDVDEEEDSDEDDGYNEISNPYSTKYGWGSGQALNGPPQVMKKPVTSNKQSSTGASLKPQNQEEAVVISRLPITEPCRLRIRLPGSMNESILEEFDSNEKLAVIYKWVNSQIPTSSSSSGVTSPRLVQLPGIFNSSGTQVIGVSGGAFANPHSEYGFTLLTAHPKREYSLEMHGSTSIKDLGMSPSASLTVMMCSSRGQVKRGVLERKLAEAQGDAMDVEDLGYEALQELVEKIGVASPGDGTWKGIDEITLEKISKVASPKDFLAQKSSEEEDSKCPICLGEFDPNESDPQLRTLNHCHHTFHSSCLLTWFSTKTNCPLCNHSFSQV